MKEGGLVDHERARAAVAELLAALGEDPEREGLRDTPARVVKAWAEMLGGRELKVTDVLKTTSGELGFRDMKYDSMIVMAAIPFVSTCEHHMIPFRGHADVGYIPGDSGMVVGASKLPRLVRMFAERLQVQERLTAEIASGLMSEVDASGVGVRICAEHLCCSARGIRTSAQMVTQELLGCFRDHEVRAEFIALSNHGGSR